MDEDLSYLWLIVVTAGVALLGLAAGYAGISWNARDRRKDSAREAAPSALYERERHKPENQM